jgi:hypothetical protein
MSKQRPYKSFDTGLYLAVCAMFIPLFWFITTSVITYRNPVALTTDREGNVYVAETLQNQIRKFSPEGDFKASFGGEGSQLKHFASGPYGITVDRRGNVYGTSSSDKSVKKYDRQGNYVRRWLAVNDIRGLAADNAGNLYFTLQDMATVFQYDEAGNPAKEIDVTKDLPLIPPKTNLYIFVDAQNTLYVAARNVNGILKYSQEQYTGLITTTAPLNAKFVVDQNGYFYVIGEEATVQKWDWNGNLIKTWGGYGTQPEKYEFKYGNGRIIDLAIDNNNRIFTLHSNHDQIHVKQFDSDGRFINKWSDGYAFGSASLAQAFMFVSFIMTLWIVTKIKNFLLPVQQPKLAPLPSFVIAGQLDPQLLQDNFTATGIRTDEDVLTRLKKSNIQKREEAAQNTKIYIGQALNTINPNNHSTVKIKASGTNSINRGVVPLWIVFAVIFPVTMFVTTTVKHLSFPVWVYAGAISFSFLLGITALSFAVRIYGRIKKHRPYLTTNEFMELFVFNLCLVVGYTLICVVIEYSFKLVRPNNIFSEIVIADTLVGACVISLGIYNVWTTWVLKKQNAGRYEEAVQRIRFLRAKLGISSLYVYEANAYRLSGRYDAAEKVLYTALMQPRFHNDESASKLLEALARLRLEQERFAESLYFAEKAHELNPKATAHILLAAEVYLRARVKLDRVWQLLAIVQSKDSLTKEDKSQDNYTEALAQALSGEYKWAQELLKRALAKADKSYKPGIAAIYFRAGQIADMQGDNEGAIEYYRRAQFADPFGTTGTKAARILRFSPTPQPATLP